MAGLYAQKYSPARAPSPHHLRNNNNISTQSCFLSAAAAAASSSDVDSQYLSELLAEHQKLAPFTQVLPICSRLLNQEILRVSGMFTNQGFSNFDRMQRGSPSPLPILPIPIPSSSDIKPPNFRGGTPPLGGAWNTLPLPDPDDRLGGPQGIMDWQAAPPTPNSNIAKRILRLEIPLDSYPTLQFNFVGRLLGPRGNSLKRVEASTGCRVFIRGKGSIKDTDKEETLRGRPGYEHLNDPLHILIEAELPVSIVDIRLRQAKEIIEELLKPVEESQDFYKRQQLRELAMLNSNIREESPQPRSSVSPFSSSGMKRAKTGQ